MAYKHRQIISIVAAIAVLVGAFALFSFVMTGAANAKEPATVLGDSPPGDLDCDGLYEDVNGDDKASVTDVQALFANRNAIGDRDDATMFDYTDNGDVSVLDVQAMFAGLGDSDTRFDLCELEQKVHENINDERTSRNLNSLDYDTGLSQIARYHSEDLTEYHTESMIKNKEHYHTTPDGETRQDRYDKFGYQCKAYFAENKYGIGAENVYYETLEPSDTESSIAQQAVNWWMGSADHKDNILKDRWNNEGIGIATGNGKIYITQNFC